MIFNSCNQNVWNNVWKKYFIEEFCKKKFQRNLGENYLEFIDSAIVFPFEDGKKRIFLRQKTLTIAGKAKMPFVSHWNSRFEVEQFF